MTPFELATALGGKVIRRGTKGATGLCPSHNDHSPSLDIDEKDGKLLVICRAGCDQKTVIAELQRLNLWPKPNGHNPSNGHTGGGVTLEQYATFKNLPVQFLKDFGLRDIKTRDGGTWIEMRYYGPPGADTYAVKYRVLLAKTNPDDKVTRLKKGHKARLYGLWKLPEIQQRPGVVLVEGESDTQTLWLHDFPALGVPGWGWREERDAGFLDGVGKIYAVVEPDHGGASLLARLAKSAIRERLRIVRMPRETKDPSALYLADPAGFVKAFEALLDAAEPPPPMEEPDSVPRALPIIQTGGGRLPGAIDQAEEILIEGDRDVYAFGDQVVRPALRPIRIADDKTTIGLRLVPIGPDHMIERFTRIIDFQRFDQKRRDWVSIDCPRSIAATYLARIGLWRLPQLTALTTAPLLLANGRILDTPGFDAASGILFDAQGVTFPPVPKTPSQDEALKALEFLMAPFCEFPFVDEASKSVLLSLLLSAVSRFAVSFVPCHAFDAPAPGTGKSKLFDCASILQAGQECEVVSQAEDEVEFEKKLFAILLAGGTMISIDNCDRPLDSPFMCMALTQPFVQSRILGLSKTASVPNVAILGANGNNFSYAGDMLRRGLTGHLDAGTEKPWEREFKHEDPVIVFKRDRHRYVVAALTVLRGYIHAGQPKTKALPLGGFEGWGRVVRDALLWLGQADPTSTIESARTADPRQQKLVAVLTQWRSALGNSSLTARAVIEKAYKKPEFRDALLDVAGERSRISVDRLGSWLSRNKQKVADNCRLVADPPLKGYGRWRLEQRQNDGKWL